MAVVACSKTTLLSESHRSSYAWPFHEIESNCATSPCWTIYDTSLQANVLVRSSVQACHEMRECWAEGQPLYKSTLVQVNPCTRHSLSKPLATIIVWTEAPFRQALGMPAVLMLWLDPEVLVSAETVSKIWH